MFFHFLSLLVIFFGWDVVVNQIYVLLIAAQCKKFCPCRHLQEHLLLSALFFFKLEHVETTIVLLDSKLNLKGSFGPWFLQSVSFFKSDIKVFYCLFFFVPRWSVFWGSIQGWLVRLLCNTLCFCVYLCIWVFEYLCICAGVCSECPYKAD